MGCPIEAVNTIFGRLLPGLGQGSGTMRSCQVGGLFRRRTQRPDPHAEDRGTARVETQTARGGESADKPGSVWRSHSSGIGVTADLVRPTRSPRGPRAASYSVLLRMGFAVPRTVTGRAVRSYRTVSPLPHASCGGLFSAALSVSSRCPGVTWHPALWSPDFPRRLIQDAATA